MYLFPLIAIGVLSPSVLAATGAMEQREMVVPQSAFVASQAAQESSRAVAESAVCGAACNASHGRAPTIEVSAGSVDPLLPATRANAVRRVSAAAPGASADGNVVVPAQPRGVGGAAARRVAPEVGDRGGLGAVVAVCLGSLGLVVIARRAQPRLGSGAKTRIEANWT